MPTVSVKRSEIVNCLPIIVPMFTDIPLLLRGAVLTDVKEEDIDTGFGFEDLAYAGVFAEEEEGGFPLLEKNDCIGVLLFLRIVGLGFVFEDRETVLDNELLEEVGECFTLRLSSDVSCSVFFICFVI